MKGLRKAWVAGMRITIDESMVKYNGKSVGFVQYLPAKPIKHGIKNFSVCCSYSAFLLGYEVYLGKQNYGLDDGSSKNVVLRLLDQTGLLLTRGRVLYADNWYASLSLAKDLYENFGWTMLGTITPTEKKKRTSEDIPFIKLSNGGLNDVTRGWFREAVLKVHTKRNEHYFIQTSTWKDRKQVMFLHTHVVGRSDGFSVKRNIKGNKNRVTFKSTRSQAKYVKYFNAVDRNDRDSSDYSVSQRTHRWYLRLYFFLLDRVIHGCFVVVVSLRAVYKRWDTFGKKWWEEKFPN